MREIQQKYIFCGISDNNDVRGARVHCLQQFLRNRAAHMQIAKKCDHVIGRENQSVMRKRAMEQKFKQI